MEPKFPFIHFARIDQYWLQSLRVALAGSASQSRLGLQQFRKLSSLVPQNYALPIGSARSVKCAWRRHKANGVTPFGTGVHSFYLITLYERRTLFYWMGVKFGAKAKHPPTHEDAGWRWLPCDSGRTEPAYRFRRISRVSPLMHNRTSGRRNSSPSRLQLCHPAPHS